MSYITSFSQQLTRMTSSFGTNDWALVAVIVVGIGILCMRGHSAYDTL